MLLLAPSAGAAAGAAPPVRALAVLRGHTGGLSDAAWSLDGALLATGGDDARVRMWAAATAAPAGAALAGHTAPVLCLDWSPRGTLLASGAADEAVRLWDPRVPAAVRVLPAHSEPVSSVHFNADVRKGAEAGGDARTICALPARHIPSFAAARRATRFAGNAARHGRLRRPHVRRRARARARATAALPRRLHCALSPAFARPICSRLWDVASGHCLATLQPSDRVSLAPVSCVRFSPNSRYVLAATLDGRLRLWDFLLGKPLKTYSGHANLALCCAATFSAPTCAVEADGGDAPSAAAAAAAPAPLIVAGAEDGRVHLWDINSRAQVGAFAAAGSDEPILGLDCHPHAQAIATGAGGAQSTAVSLWLPEQ